MAGPLSHIRVLDFTALVQGPMATQIFGDLGADVIKFERPDGEWMRHWGILNGKSHGEMDSFLAFNRNKRSVAVDLKDPNVRERILELAKDADVVVENFRAGVMDRLGLGYDDFRAVNPGDHLRVVVGLRPDRPVPQATRAGPPDPGAQRPDVPDRPPGRSADRAAASGISDQYTALHIAIGVLAALTHRAATGEGQKIEVDLFSCTVALQQQELTYFFGHGELPPRPVENLGSVWSTAPFGIYKTSDGSIAIAMTPCPILAEALDLSFLAQFDTLDKMVESRGEIYAHLAGAPARRHERALDRDPARARRLVRAGPRRTSSSSTTRRSRTTSCSGTSRSATERRRSERRARRSRSRRRPRASSHGVPRAGQHTAELFPDQA